jgi:hypothetical protein
MRRRITIALALGVLTLIALGFAHLALVDIAHAAEPDLSMEWRMLRVAALLVLMFIAFAMGTLWRLRNQVE